MWSEAWSQKTKFMGQHGAHLCPVGPRWAPCWPHETCCQGRCFSGAVAWSPSAYGRLSKFSSWMGGGVKYPVPGLYPARLISLNFENRSYGSPSSFVTDVKSRSLLSLPGVLCQGEIHHTGSKGVTWVDIHPWLWLCLSGQVNVKRRIFDCSNPNRCRGDSVVGRSSYQHHGMHCGTATRRVAE